MTSRLLLLLSLVPASGGERAALTALAPPPTPSTLLHLFVGFARGSCEPYGDHPAALYAARLAIPGAGHKPAAWALSKPLAGFSLGALQLAGIVSALTVDAASSTAYGMWLLGAPGGGPPYVQQMTVMSAGSTKAAPVVVSTCTAPSTGYGAPYFDRRVSASAPFFYRNGTFFLLRDPGAVNDGADAGTADDVAPGPALDGPELLDVLSSSGSFVPLSTAHRARPRLGRTHGALPANCTQKRLGVVANGPLRAAVIADSTFSVPSALIVMLPPSPVDEIIVSIQRVAVLTGEVLSTSAAPCASCSSVDFGGFSSAANGLVFFSTINYTTSISTIFFGPAAGNAPLRELRGSAALLPRDSVAAMRFAGGKAAPFPLGAAGLRTTTLTDHAACHNATARGNLTVGGAASAGAAYVESRVASVPLCALPTADGGCIVPMVGFV